MAAMTITRLAVATLVAVLATLATPTQAAAEEHTYPPHGYTQPTVCVVSYTDDAARWRVKAAVRLWNKAQSHVRLTMAQVPGCDMLEVHAFAGPEHPDWNGYVEWPTNWEDSPTYQRWAYPVARVWLNHAKLVDSFKPKYRGTKRQCWRKRVVAHEIGHTLGLDHTTGSESVMSYEHDYLAHCGRPSDGDVAAVAALYTPATTAPTGKLVRRNR